MHNIDIQKGIHRKPESSARAEYVFGCLLPLYTGAAGPCHASSWHLFILVSSHPHILNVFGSRVFPPTVLRMCLFCKVSAGKCKLYTSDEIE